MRIGKRPLSRNHIRQTEGPTQGMDTYFANNHAEKKEPQKNVYIIKETNEQKLRPQNQVRMKSTKSRMDSKPRPPNPMQPSHNAHPIQSMSKNQIGMNKIKTGGLGGNTGSKGGIKLGNLQHRKDQQMYENVWDSPADTKQKENSHFKNNRYDLYASEDKSFAEGMKSREALQPDNKPRSKRVTDLKPKNFLQLDPKNLRLAEKSLHEQSPPKGAPSEEKKKRESHEEENNKFRIRKKQSEQPGPCEEPQGETGGESQKRYRPVQRGNERGTGTWQMAPREAEEAVRVETEFRGCEETEAVFLELFKGYVGLVDQPALVRSQESCPVALGATFLNPTFLRVWEKQRVRGKTVLSAELRGVAIYQLDNNYLKARRMRIVHISSVEFADFQDYLCQIIQHIFNSDDCTEIHCHFQHIKEEDKLNMFPPLKDITKAAGMKWKMMNNYEDGSRWTIFEAKRNFDKYPLKRPAANQDPVKQISMALISDYELSNCRDLLNSERQFRGNDPLSQRLTTATSCNSRPFLSTPIMGCSRSTKQSCGNWANWAISSRPQER
jgi:hypothetical protein